MEKSLLQQADELYKSGQFAEALEKYLDELWHGEATAYLYKMIAHCNKIGGNNENAAEYYEKSLDLYFDDPETLYNLGETLQILNEQEDAQYYFEQIINHPNFADSEIRRLSLAKIKEIESVLLNRKGGQLLKEGLLSEALDAFTQAMELNPKDRRNYLNISVVHLKTGNIEEAENWMLKTIEIDPEYIRAYFNLGTIYLKSNRFKSAVNIFEEALTISPDDPECADIQKNLDIANEKYETAIDEMTACADGETISINMEQLKELANSIIADKILSVDIAVQSCGKNRFIAYGRSKTYTIYSNDGQLIIT